RRKSYATYKGKMLGQPSWHDCCVDDYHHWGRRCRLSAIPGICRASNRRTPTKRATYYTNGHCRGDLRTAESRFAHTPDFIVGQAVATATSPDGNTLLILTSGYNRNADPAGKGIPAESNEYVFVYDISGSNPVKRQVLQVANTFNGIAWHPNGQAFYVSGGVNDNVHVFKLNNGTWSEDGAPIALGHTNQGLAFGPMVAGLAVNASGTQLVVANFENDSVSLVNLAQRLIVADVDLRPGKANP